MVKKAVEVPGNYFYVFPTKEDARRALWEKVMDDGSKLLGLLPQEDFAGLVVRKSNQEMVMELNNNSTIRIVGLDKNPDAIRGITPTGVVFSEFAFSDPDAYRNLIPALRREGCWIIINSTPNGRNHFYDMYQGVLQKKDWYVSHKQALWPEKENYLHVADKDYFDDLLDEGIMMWDDLEREYGCSFSTGMKGSFYMDHIETAYSTGRISEYPYDDSKLVHTYWDLGVDDSTACWFVQFIGNKAVFIDYYEDHAKGTNELVQMLSDKGYEYGTHYLPHDAGHRRQGKEVFTTASAFEESLTEHRLSDDVVILNSWPGCVQDGINATRSKFSTLCFDSRNCKDGLKKLELYHRRWDKKRQAFLKDPVHDSNSHAADALRMFGISDDPRQDQFWSINNIKVISDFNPI
jgi:hypothetical protein